MRRLGPSVGPVGPTSRPAVVRGLLVAAGLRTAVVSDDLHRCSHGICNVLSLATVLRLEWYYGFVSLAQSAMTAAQMLVHLLWYGEVVLALNVVETFLHLRGNDLITRSAS